MAYEIKPNTGSLFKNDKMKNVGLVSALIYTTVSIAAAVLFVISTSGGRYTLVERIGGAAWVFLLSMIITMPLLIPRVKRRLGRGSE